MPHPSRSDWGRRRCWRAASWIRLGSRFLMRLVNVDSWRGLQALGVFLFTDAVGRFRWEDGPPDSVRIYASRVGYVAGPEHRVTPGGREVILTLKRSLSISGQVKDSATDKPVEYNVKLAITEKPQEVVISGMVRRPDGRPLGAALVTVTYPRPAVHIKNGKFDPIQPMKTTATDCAGPIRSDSRACGEILRRRRHPP